jgi:type VI secretion system protein ImpK
MNPSSARFIFPIINDALDLHDRIGRGGVLDIEAEQRRLLDRFRLDGEARRTPDLAGDGLSFLGVRYALACWVDELFIVHSEPSWADLWKERILELALFGTRDSAWKFWEQLDLALRRPGTARTAGPVGPDALETFFLCLALGFRGRYFDDPARVREYFEDLRSQASRSSAWSSPRDLGVRTDVEPLAGRDELRRVVWLYGGLSLSLTLVLLVLLRLSV